MLKVIQRTTIFRARKFNLLYFLVAVSIRQKKIIDQRN